MVEKISSSKDLKALEDKREVLEKAVKIALNIERLHSSLDATLLMGRSSAELSDEALATIDELDGSIRAQSIEKLKEGLLVLEALVRSRLSQILKIAEMEPEELLAPDAGEMEVVLNDYSKQAQTAIALRILLHSRGEVTAPVELHVPVEQIQAHLRVVEKKEQAYRRIIKSEMVSMITETTRMLAAEGLSPTMRQFLLASNDDLQRNLDHLDAGSKITTMPIAIEIIEMGEREITSFDTAPTPTQTSEVPTVQKQRLVAPMEYSPAPPKQDFEQVKKKGFFARLMRWVSTPDQVTWKQTKQSRDEKDGRKK